MPMTEREPYINKGRDRYEPIRPRGFLTSLVDGVVQVTQVDDLYYLSPERENAGVPTITGYQEWVEKGWKEKHGSFQASARFMRKLFEEIEEVDQADCLFMQSNCELGSEQAADLASELGDVLWCATAVASNSNADIDAAMKLKLIHQVMGTGLRKGLDTAKPDWHDALAIVATKWEDIDLADISDVVACGFEPIYSTAMDIADDEAEYSVRGHIGMIGDAAMSAWISVRNQFCDGDEKEMEKWSFNDWKHTSLIAEFTSDIYLNVAYIAYHRLGMSLDDVVAKNMAKINARIEAGRVDKTDGERSTELL